MNVQQGNRWGGIGCLLVALIVIGVVVAFGIWAWSNPGTGNDPSYWH